MLNFSNQIQASRSNGQGTQAGSQANFGGQGQQQTRFDQYSPSKGYDHELDQILKSSPNSGVKTKVRTNDFSMSQFDVGSTIKSPRSKKDMPVNMSILDSMSQLEMLLQNTPDNRNRNGLYKPAFRNIEVERPSYGTSISSSTFNSPGISGLDMNAGNQGSAGFRNANLNENSNGYNNMYFASQNPGTRSGFADNQGTFGKKNDTSGFVRFDQQSDFGNQSQPQRNLDMPTSSNNGENRSGIGAFGAYRGNIDPFSNFGNQTQDSGFTTNTSRIAKPGNENNFGVRNQNQASPDLSQKMWPVSDDRNQPSIFGVNSIQNTGNSPNQQVFSDDGHAFPKPFAFTNTEDSSKKDQLANQSPYLLRTDNLIAGQGSLNNPGRPGAGQNSSINEPFKGIEPRFVNSEQKSDTRFGNSDFNNGQRTQKTQIQSEIVGGQGFGGQNPQQGGQTGSNTNQSFSMQPITVMSSLGAAPMPESGKHTRTFPNGSVYTGDFKNRQRHGIGRQQWPDGSVYDGQWQADHIQGDGKLTHGNGDEYTGSFVKNCAQGKGKYVRYEGGEYVGEWVADRQNGKGIEVSPDGDRYEGVFKAGKKEGNGFYEWSNGCKYEGNWNNNRINGEGKFAWPDGRMYKGQFLNNKLHGNGTFYWPDGSHYVGQYNCDKRHGSGTMTFSDKKIFKGIWNMGQMHGEGVVSLPDGNVKKGRWQNSRRIEWIA